MQAIGDVWGGPALPTILGGLNQTVLLAMVMSVIVAMIGAEGLGLVVLQGLGRLDIGRAAVGGIGIVLLAIMHDRITQAVAEVRAADQWAAITNALRGRVLPRSPSNDVSAEAAPDGVNG